MDSRLQSSVSQVHRSPAFRWRPVDYCPRQESAQATERGPPARPLGPTCPGCLSSLLNGCRWVWGDAQELPFAGGSVDAVTMGYGLRNVTDMDLALREIHRILKPGEQESAGRLPLA